jgi:sugar O-acyltransferase (sialic acid O-acetyltransferase NeuD family)
MPGIKERRVLIIGVGGHGQVVADILWRMREAESALAPIGFLDDRQDLVGRTFLGIPVLGAIAAHRQIAHDAIIVAIGINEIRRKISQMLQKTGEAFALAQHPKAVVAPDVQLGDGGMVCAGVVVNTGTTVGEAVILNTGCTVDHHNVIGSYAHIAPGVHLGGEVEIGEGSLIGIGATVMPGKRIGSWSIVGAGALVHQDVPERSLVVGVPGRVVKKL